MASTTRDIRRRIRSVRNTQQITKAMKMVAAAKLRKAQSRLMAIRPYEDALAGKLALVLPRLVGDESPLLAARGSGEKLALVVIAADKGLCGAFTHNVLRRAEAFLREHAGCEVHLTAIGKNGTRYFVKSGREPVAAYTEMSENVTLAQAASVMRKLVAAYLDGQVHEVHLLYSYFNNVISQQVRAERLLPFEVPAVENLAEVGPQEEYIMEPGPEEVCDYLLGESLAVRLFRALLESASSEHGARMTSMDNATNNADDLISDLTLQFNRARQSAITTEISEIVGGAEALSKGR